MLGVVVTVVPQRTIKSKIKGDIFWVLGWSRNKCSRDARRSSVFTYTVRARTRAVIFLCSTYKSMVNGLSVLSVYGMGSGIGAVACVLASRPRYVCTYIHTVAVIVRLDKKKHAGR